MAKYKRVASVYKKEPEWPGVLAAIILIFIVLALVA